jgi:hypothetical protein
MTYTIRYRRPDAPWSVVNMTIPDNGEAAVLLQQTRLETLGYSIIDVTPPISLQMLKPA